MSAVAGQLNVGQWGVMGSYAHPPARTYLVPAPTYVVSATNYLVLALTYC